MDIWHRLSMITGAQIRSARAALCWSVQELADRASVAAKTITRIEAVAGVPQSRTGTLLAIQAALQGAGIEFIGTPEDAPGIRLRSQPPDATGPR
jgi:transcriptional regulator with XRE-family HTH domain